MNEVETEAEVLEGCRRGDRAAFQRLFERHKDRVYSTALHFTGDEAQARDITQQVFLKLFTVIGQFRQDASFSTWLYRIVANACEDERRKRKRFVAIEDEGEVSAMASRGSQEDGYMRREISESVGAAVSGLSPKLRLPILLRYVDGLSYDEIAEALGCSKGTVASRLNRGHQLLAQKLGHLRGALARED